MLIPLRYNLRNLAQRRITTLATAAGIGITVGVFVAVLGLVEGVHATFIETGEPLNILVVRRGSQSETGSIVERGKFETLRTLEGIARDEAGLPMISIERVVYVNLERRTEGRSNVVIRGMSSQGRALRPAVRLVDGRWPQPGAREVTVSRTIAERFSGCGPGEEMRTGRDTWRVVGVFDAGQTAYSSEMWADADAVAQVFNRYLWSVTLLRAESRSALRTLLEEIPADRRMNLDARTERDYYAEQTKAAAPIAILGNLIAIVMAIGSAFAAMNTMYAAVAGRIREIAVLGVLGFSRRAIWLSFLIESLLLSAIGGVIGGLLALPLNGIATGTTNWFSFSEMTFQFRITPRLLAIGMAFSLVVGLIGGMLPAIRAARQHLVDSLRGL